MSFLLDTNVVSETRKSRPDAGVVDWIGSVGADHLHLSVLTLGEIERGVAQLRRRGDDRQASSYAVWLASLTEAFAGRIVPVSLEIARRWGQTGGINPGSTVDALLSATAQAHGWTLVTRNVKDFASLDVPILNPFTGT
ncbi:type II toxin-antitoxin system VapC family toxin [Frankia sp. CNm7]|uniref:Ribonuclease VapC n=1 Tax=Frankia nepalensis TaxID=1836974 RepID=A0A937RGJ6_9ACTN|nr:type II toxin-antitoxin system VapC family toxin [Frankia nepalensis]MBL7495867.1 type II toxin-antitoxin system VapC family toxin [Frankia nepalensis]MBL7510406.1 type II toxin-antitoxin system VapC family toxin [Frankia nepalensis]MBL7524745.1 type II toxin-antitoxin system VapC family toxin [Frankia nepalensis]MBL7630005.1 type II toxin-antitoxin system VapC family toxin [Frankia nepalensis]